MRRGKWVAEVVVAFSRSKSGVCLLRWKGKRLEAGGNAALLAAPGGGGRKRKRLESGRSHCSCKGSSASGSALVTDWLLLLPPRVKTQLACSGWGKGPVIYSLVSAQPLRDSRIAPWVGCVGRWGELDPRARSVFCGRGRRRERRVRESGSSAGVPPASLGGSRFTRRLFGFGI